MHMGEPQEKAPIALLINLKRAVGVDENGAGG